MQTDLHAGAPAFEDEETLFMAPFIFYLQLLENFFYQRDKTQSDIMNLALRAQKNAARCSYAARTRSSHF
jgi:hypothetical protein